MAEDKTGLEVEFTGDTSKLDKQIQKSAAEAQKQWENAVGQALEDAPKKVTSSKKAKKKAEEAGDDIGSAFLKGLALPNIASGLFVAERAAQALKNVTLDYVNIFEGEKLLKIDKQFQALSQTFGIAGERIRDSLLAASGGLIDDDALTANLNEKIVTFSGNVEKLPALLELSRKAAKLFGTDALQVFEQLSFAAETGQGRGIKFLLPTLDFEKEVQKYAVANQKLASEIKGVELQQVRLNAILAQAGERLKGVSTDTEGAGNAYTRFGVAYDNFTETFQKASAKAFGPLLENFFNGLTTSLNRMSGAALESKTGFEGLTAQVKELQTAIAQIQSESDAAGAIGNLGAQARLNAELDLYEKKLGFAKLELEGLEEQERRRAQFIDRNAGKSNPTVATPFASAGPSQKFLANIDALNKEILAKTNATNQQLLQAQYQASASSLNLLSLEVAQKKQVDADFFASRLALVQSAFQKQLITEAQFDQISKSLRNNQNIDELTGTKLLDDNIIRLREERNAKLLTLKITHAQLEAEQDRLQYQQDEQAFLKSASNFETTGQAFLNVFDAIKLGAREMSLQAGQAFLNIGKQALQGIGGGVARGFKQFALAVREGKNGLQAFGEAFLASIGDMLVQSGTAFVLEGTALSFLGDPRGPGLIGAGAAMIGFGAILSASVGGGDTQGIGGTDTGGGVASSNLAADPSAPISAPEDKAVSAPKTAVNVVIQGNILDRRESGLYIAEVLADAFREQDIEFRGA